MGRRARPHRRAAVAAVGGGVLLLDAGEKLAIEIWTNGSISPKDTLARVEHPIERAAKQIGVSYVDLEGDIAIISSGAGLGMATMDVVGQRLKPANFLETGGGITEELMYKTTALVLQKPGLRGLLINLYGGINPIHEGAKGIVRVLKEQQVKIPVVAKALGNRQEETWATLKEAGVIIVTDITTEAAVDALCAALGAVH